MVNICSSKNFVSEMESYLRQLLNSHPDADRPRLDVILVGDHPASLSYVHKKRQTIEAIGGLGAVHQFSESATAMEIRSLILKLNADHHCHGILLQLPLPAHLEPHQLELINAIDPAKDVDGLTDWQQQQLYLNRPGLVPCTPLGMLHFLLFLRNPQWSMEQLMGQLYPDHPLIKATSVSVAVAAERTHFQTLAGQQVLVLGRSPLVGKPLVQLLNQWDATVTWAHSKTNLDRLKLGCREHHSFDVVISAVGKANLIDESWFSKQSPQLYLDVGTNRWTDAQGVSRLVGDIALSAKSATGFDHITVTPVPGGVGPLTVNALMWNLVSQWGEGKMENGKF